jgi:hypothetical protein
MIELKRLADGGVVLNCTEVELADLRWLVGQAIRHFVGNAPYSNEHLGVAVEVYNALNVGLAGGAEIYLRGSDPT